MANGRASYYKSDKQAKEGTPFANMVVTKIWPTLAKTSEQVVLSINYHNLFISNNSFNLLKGIVRVPNLI